MEDNSGNYHHHKTFDWNSWWKDLWIHTIRESDQYPFGPHSSWQVKPKNRRCFPHLGFLKILCFNVCGHHLKRSQLTSYVVASFRRAFIKRLENWSLTCSAPCQISCQKGTQDRFFTLKGTKDLKCFTQSKIDSQQATPYSSCSNNLYYVPHIWRWSHFSEEHPLLRCLSLLLITLHPSWNRYLIHYDCLHHGKNTTRPKKFQFQGWGSHVCYLTFQFLWFSSSCMTFLFLVNIVVFSCHLSFTFGHSW